MLPGPVYTAITVLTALATLIALPSAFATWYSRCFKVSLAAGFGIVLGPALFLLTLWLAAPKHVFALVGALTALLVSALLIVGVVKQFSSRCALGYEAKQA